jgi:putative membrane protein
MQWCDAALSRRLYLWYGLRMSLAASIAIVVVALLHFYFFVLEAFLWNTPYGRRVFRLTEEFAAQTRDIMKNQGLYNSFLAAGLVWTLAVYGLSAGRPVLTFFLVCVIVAGLVGGITVNRRIITVQALPAAAALALLYAAR